ncbi:MAG: ribonuclease III [Pseudomonadota bacterium]|nr:ribonuclease III [Pseudomonadota bacterium]
MPKAAANSRERGRKRFGDLERRLGYEFSDFSNVERALTHTSVRKRPDDDFHYERLEFLGDRVLGLAVADLLHASFPEADEGELSLRLNALVNGRTLAAIADELRLHEFIRTGGDLKEITGKRLQSVRADVLEAIIASIYLDGGLDAASAFIDRFWKGRLNEVDAARRDSKTELQEWAHANRLGTPKYRETKRTGPDHDPVFTVAVKVQGLPEMTGNGRSKRTAEQDAARALLVRENVWEAEENSA